MTLSDLPPRIGSVPRRAPDDRPRLQRLTAPAVVAATVLAASLALHLRDPHRSGSWGWCPWLAVTGTDCPGCGGLRAVHDLTGRRVADAASSNLLLVGSLPVTAVWFARWVRDRWVGVQGGGERVPAVVGYVCTSLVIAWWIVRNLPGLEWLRAGF